MIRYTLFVLAIVGTAATAIAAVQPKATAVITNPAHETVITKNSPFPVLGPITVEECATEDCSDVES
jgi:hypothetical protein